MKSYEKKIVKSGDMIEVYFYEKPIIYEKDKLRYKNSKSKNRDKDIRKNSLIRAKRNLSRIIYCNVKDGSKFLTLTYEKNIMNLDEANDEFKKFIKRLNYKYGQTIKYTAVVELQKRGAIHYHVIIYNAIKFDFMELEKIWGNGFIKIDDIKNNYIDIEKVKNYMVKDIMNDEKKFRGRKKYFNSRGLKRPDEIKECEEVENFLNDLSIDYLRTEREFGCDYNRVKLRKYVITQ